VFKRVISRHFQELGENAGAYAVNGKEEGFFSTVQEAKKWVDLELKRGSMLYLVNKKNKTTDPTDKRVFEFLNTFNPLIPWSRGDWIEVKEQ
jgi:hypothetical protein